MKRSIVWFKTDLRLHDNETLVQAIQYSDEILPVYCLDPADFVVSSEGLYKTGSHRTEFLLEALQDLDAQLRQLGSGLLLLQGDSLEQLPKLVRQYGVSKVYAKKEVAPEEKKRTTALEKELWKSNCPLETFSTSTLYHAVDLPFSIKDIPDVFTKFRTRLERDASVRVIFEAPVKIKSPFIPPLILPSREQLCPLPLYVDERRALSFRGGETEGLKRLNYYFSQSHAISRYKETRNEMIGPDYSSKFSAWLAIGCLSPREIYYALKEYEAVSGANESTYWLYFELLWRDYFRFMMKKHRHKLFLSSGIKEDLTADSVLQDPELFENWKEGKTGIEIVDACMIELKLTGYLSNRGRQLVASFFINDLKLDWRLGAQYFEQQLIDYDVCSNYGNWAYLAGVGNDPRGKRYFNQEAQSQTYDPKKEFRKLWLN